MVFISSCLELSAEEVGLCCGGEGVGGGGGRTGNSHRLPGFGGGLSTDKLVHHVCKRRQPIIQEGA